MRVWDIAHLDSRMAKLYPLRGKGTLNGAKNRCRRGAAGVTRVRIWSVSPPAPSADGACDAPGELRIDLRDGSRIVAKTDSVFRLRMELSKWRSLGDARTVFNGVSRPLHPVDLIISGNKRTSPIAAVGGISPEQQDWQAKLSEIRPSK